MSEDASANAAMEAFIAHRNLLFTVAYEMLSSAADAEDVLQETWLRWADVDFATVRDARAYLVRMTTRQALNRVRTLSRRRESYVGPWLPEPLITAPDVAADVELAESVSIAMLTVLETLGPAERAVFVLREVFDMPYDEIAAAVDKSVPAVRQIANRARQHVAARRPRMNVTQTEQQEVLDRFLTVLTTGDVQALMDVLAPDVVVVSDGGGEVHAARRPIEGVQLVAVALSRFAQIAPGADIARVSVNGMPGVKINFAGQRAAVSVTVEGGKITKIYVIANPHKLARLDAETALAR